MSFSGKDAAGARISLLNDELFREVDSDTHHQYDNNVPFRPRHGSIQSSNVSSPDDTPSTRHNFWATRNESNSPISPVSNGFCTQHNSPNLSHQCPLQHFSCLQRNSPSAYHYPPLPAPNTVPYNHGQHSAAYLSSTNSSPTVPQYPYAQPYLTALNHPNNVHHAVQDGAEAPKGEKRYPCRLAVEYGCTKTFTTSGHASRHSKIHTAEKMVTCTFPGCDRKFTRSDNMKQHMETHKKRRGAVHGVRKPNTRSSRTRSRESSYSSTAMDMLADIAMSHQAVNSHVDFQFKNPIPLLVE